MSLSNIWRRQFFIHNKCAFVAPKRTAYVVLVPEIGDDLPEKNPLMLEDGLPEFNNITIEKCVATVARQTNDFERNIKNVEAALAKSGNKNVDVFKQIIEPIESTGMPLETTWGLAKTLYLGNRTLMPTKSYLAIHDRARRARSAKFNSIPIYKTLKSHVNDANFQQPDEKSRTLQKYVLEGKLNGLDLPDTKRIRFLEDSKKLYQERETFREKLNKSTSQFVHVVKDFELIKDFPPDLVKNMAADSSQPLSGPWKVTLQPHVYAPFMEYCSDRDLRWNIWQASVRRSSGYADKSIETSNHVEQIRSLRRDKAKLLGYPSFAHMSMETKMAGNVEQVQEMMSTLLSKAKPAQELELSSLQTFASNQGFKSEIQFWDIPYWKRKQSMSLFNYDDEQIREYFPLENVLLGLFKLSEKLFKIKIQQRTSVATWHKDVKYFDVFDEENTSSPLAGFYLDPYSRREQKLRLTEDSGYMIGIRNRSGITQTNPLASLIFNFQTHSDQPALLRFRDVQVLFHKFGHALQHLLTRAHYSEVAGLSNIEWDAVDVCGHVLSHWLYDIKTLQSLSSHISTQEPLPMSMCESIQQVRTHMAGYELSRELYLSCLDLELHLKKDFWLDVVKKLWPQFNCLPLDKKDSHVCSFAAIFSEDWAAAYYSHLWARIIAADVYSAFHEAIRNETKENEQISDVGKRFRDTFLALGGSCHPSQVFRMFRGRDPSSKALIKILGLKKATQVDGTDPLVQVATS